MILICYSDGSSQQGILLNLQGDMLRIAGKDSDDVLEFRMIHGKWVSEDCEVVTFEFPLAVFEAIGMMPPSQETAVCAPVADLQSAAAPELLN